MPRTNNSLFAAALNDAITARTETAKLSTDNADRFERRRLAAATVRARVKQDN